MSDEKHINKKKVIIEKINEKRLAYEIEKLKRLRVRKTKRKIKRAENKKYNFSNATWYEDGKCMQNCEMGGTCGFPCNGDC